MQNINLHAKLQTINGRALFIICIHCINAMEGNKQWYLLFPNKFTVENCNVIQH